MLDSVIHTVTKTAVYYTLELLASSLYRLAHQRGFSAFLIHTIPSNELVSPCLCLRSTFTIAMLWRPSTVTLLRLWLVESFSYQHMTFAIHVLQFTACVRLKLFRRFVLNYLATPVRRRWCTHCSPSSSSNISGSSGFPTHHRAGVSGHPPRICACDVRLQHTEQTCFEYSFYFWDLHQEPAACKLRTAEQERAPDWNVW